MPDRYVLLSVSYIVKDCLVAPTEAMQHTVDNMA